MQTGVADSASEHATSLGVWLLALQQPVQHVTLWGTVAVEVLLGLRWHAQLGGDERL